MTTGVDAAEVWPDRYQPDWDDLQTATQEEVFVRESFELLKEAGSVAALTVGIVPASPHNRNEAILCGQMLRMVSLGQTMLLAAMERKGGAFIVGEAHICTYPSGSNPDASSDPAAHPLGCDTLTDESPIAGWSPITSGGTSLGGQTDDHDGPAYAGVRATAAHQPPGTTLIAWGMWLSFPHPVGT